MRALYWLGGIIVAGIVAWHLAFPSYTFRYRMTVKIYSAGELRQASSVIEATYYFSRLPTLSPYNWDAKVRGVAPIVDLGPNGTLVAGIQGGGPTYRKGFRRPVHISASGDSLPLSVYGVKPRGLMSVQGKRQAGPSMPPLLWLPPGANDPRSFETLLPANVGSTIGNRTSGLAVFIEPAPRSRLIERVGSAPEWLWLLRRYSAPPGTPERLPSASAPRFNSNVPGWLNMVESSYPPSFEDWSSKK